MHNGLKAFLESKAYNMRRWSIITPSQAGSGHTTSCLSAAVATRQTNIWVLAFAVLVVGAYFIRGPRSERWAALTLALLPAATLGYFIVLWGGLVPPAAQFQWSHGDSGWINSSALCFIVALTGTYGAFYSAQYWHLYHELGGRWTHVLILIMTSWVLLGVFPYRAEQAVSPGPLDQVAQLSPSIAGSPAIFFLLVPLGVVLMYVAALTAIYHEDHFFLGAFVVWLVVSLGYPMFYQRYFEVFTLFVILYYGLQARPRGRFYWVGPITLGSAFLIVDIIHHLIIRIS